MKRRDFNRVALGIVLSPILVHGQLSGQTVRQAPTKKEVTEMSASDPVAVVRQYIDAFNKGDATERRVG